MQTRVLRPGELGQSEHALWRAVQHADRTLGSPFLTPEFALAVDGVRDDARVAVVEDAGETVAFFAFSSSDDGTGAPIGATICDAQALVAREQFDWDAPELIRSTGLTSWRFDHLVATQRQFVPYHHELHPSPVVDLADGHDAYLAAVRTHSKDVLAQVARRRRKLGREVGDVVVEWHTDADAALETLFEWKSAQYRATGVWDRFDQPWIVDVVRALWRTSSDGLTGVLSTLRAGDQVVAVHFGLLGADRLIWWFPALRHDVRELLARPHPAARPRCRSSVARTRAGRPRAG